ncbi:MAG: hypothetical protein P9L99_17340 [Candidatus Lernaella stagnicola]|nr:hypothetical protein [Candidatus Lernaella stagnicola]
MRLSSLFAVLILCCATTAAAGPFDEPGVPTDAASLIGWATGYLDYAPGDSVDPQWQAPENALGPAAGDAFDIVSLGEREFGSSEPPGRITLTFDTPISNRPGCDLVVFENGLATGDFVFAELAYIEVSSDGETFARFPSVSLTADPVGEYGVVDPTDVHNLAGKHANAYGTGTGTPFDLEDLVEDVSVTSGGVDLDDIQFVRIVDVPGGGDYFDTATLLEYEADHVIYDVYPTVGSGGFDLDAVAVCDESVTDDDSPSFGDDDTTDDDDDDDSDDGMPQGSADGDDGDDGCGG